MGYVNRSPLNYRVNTTDPLNIRRENRAPIDNQDGFGDNLYTLWHDDSSNDIYMLIFKSKAQGLTIWLLLGGTSGAIETITGDVGGAVPPDAINNINLLSDGSLTVTGNPGANTLTISSTNGQVVTKFLPDAGTSPVVPDSAGEITVVGGNGILTTGGTNQWTTDMQSPFTGDFDFQSTTSGDTQKLLVNNTSNTANSQAQIVSQVGGATAGDTWYQWSVDGVIDYSAGIDNDATNDPWKLTDGANPSSGTELINIDTTNPSITFGTTGAIRTPKGTTLQRPTVPDDGMIRYNSTEGRIEFYENGAWRFLPDATPGRLVQSVRTSTQTLFSASNTIPFDDSIPQQSTEGTVLLSQAITPISDTNILYFYCDGMFGTSSSSEIITLALFQDSTEDALFATAQETSANINITQASLKYSMISGTSSSTTFKVHFGVDAGSVAVNGVGGARRFGGVSSADFWIYEVEP